MSESDHSYHTKPTAAEARWFENAHFCAVALREMVKSCVNMHPVGASLYTDGERKTMVAAADHIDRLEKELSETVGLLHSLVQRHGAPVSIPQENSSD